MTEKPKTDEIDPERDGCGKHPGVPNGTMCAECQFERAEAAEQTTAKLQQENRELRTLAKIGPWHDDCRPNRHKAVAEIEKSQKVIDKMADRITELEAALAAASAPATPTEGKGPA